MGRGRAVGEDETESGPERLSLWQRGALKSLAKYAHKHPGEPLTPRDWEAFMLHSAQPRNKAVKRTLRALPSSPRCGYCGAPFAGFGARIVRPLGYKPSRKNPNICSLCVELAPPGGMNTEGGILFADVRGFTTLTETAGGEQASTVLRRFYRHAEQVLFPEALIDKFIGDEVMALYLPFFIRGVPASSIDDEGRRGVAMVMLEHARELLERVGYGSADGPAFEVGIGIDYGTVFIGNIGDTVVRDFTAVGDVVNTAARLQNAAKGGEVLVSARLAQYLEDAPGTLENMSLKGKQEAFPAHRVSWFAASS